MATPSQLSASKQGQQGNNKPAPAPVKKEKTPAEIEAATKKKAEIAALRGSKFVEIASARARVIVDKIRVLGNCSSNNYQYTDEQLEKLFGYITGELEKCRSLFNPKAVEGKKKSDFSL